MPQDTKKEDDDKKTEEASEEKKEVSEEEALENSKNPERTKEYIEKLKQDKKNLLESLKPEQQQPPPQPEQPPVQQPRQEDYENLEQKDIDEVVKSMINEDGFLDGNKLVETLKAMDAKSQNATKVNQELKEEVRQVKEEIVRSRQSEQQREEKRLMDEVHNKYPTLDPEAEEFDEDFYSLVRNELIDQMINGRQDPMQAADKWYDKFYKRVDMTKKEKEEKEQQKETKRQINAVGTKPTTVKGYWEESEEKALREGARKGTKGSVAELLRRRGQ